MESEELALPKLNETNSSGFSFDCNHKLKYLKTHLRFRRPNWRNNHRYALSL